MTLAWPRPFNLAALATAIVVVVVQAVSADACCSWAPFTECGATTDFCSQQGSCESACGGKWMADGFGGNTNTNTNTNTDTNTNSAVYNTPSVCNAQRGVEAAHACLDWNAGSSVMEAAAAAYALRESLSQVPIFGVGSVGHADSKYNMGKCFEFALEGVDRPLVFQAINEGGDVASGNIDLQQAAGGEGAFLGCTAPGGGAAAMFPSVGGYPSTFGQCPFCGGPATRADCSSLPKWAGQSGTKPNAAGAESLVDQCEASFDLNIRLEPAAAAAAGNSNPKIVNREWIACPDELVALTGLKRTDDPTSGPVNQKSALSSSSHATRMLDCCKPSAGWQGNVYNVDPNYPAVMPCKADGFTRLDGSEPPSFPSSPTPAPAPTTAETPAPTPAQPTPAPATPAQPTPAPTPSGVSCTTECREEGRVKGRRPLAPTPGATEAPTATFPTTDPAPQPTPQPPTQPPAAGQCIGKGGAIEGDGCTGNPFADWPDWYVNPSYDANIAKTLDAAAAASMPKARATLEEMRAAPSAYWLDVKRKVTKTDTSISDTNHAHGILADARARGGKHVVLIVYDLPNRDCHAKASNGQICCSYNSDGTCNYLDTSDKCAAGLAEYETTYIDPLVELLVEFKDVPVTLVIEPDSLPNLATNNDDPRCGNIATKTAYMDGVAYAVTQLATKTSAIIYIDGAHGGWLGWEDNANDFAAMIGEMNVAKHVRGFATNVANYQPVGTAVCKASVAFNSDAIFKYCSLTSNQGGGKDSDPCCNDACGFASEWNTGVSELNYVAILARAMKNQIAGFDPRFVIDTGRNGVDDMRDSCSNWCNIRDAGVGQLPTTDGVSDPRVDALFWLKTPGESDGCTEILPDGNACPRFDSMCASVDSLGSTSSEPRAPEAGHWFEYQILQLAKNANLDGNLDGDGTLPQDPTSAPDVDGDGDGKNGDGGNGSACAEAYEQCGGNEHSGPACCVAGFTCNVSDEWYSQCIPE